MAGKSTKSIAERFWPKVDKSGGPDACWPWNASVNKKGYGQLSVGGRAGRPTLSHRLAWEFTHGLIPAGDGYHGTCVLHRCDNPPCCNPAHLFLGTNLDNVADRDAKGRVAHGEAHYSRKHPEKCPPLPLLRGEDNFRAKLTPQSVREIRQARTMGVPLIELASKYGVTKSCISAVSARYTWAHVQDETETTTLPGS